MLVGYTPRYDPADCKFKGLLLGRDPHDVMRDVLVHIDICYTDELSHQRVDKKQVRKLTEARQILSKFLDSQASRGVHPNSSRKTFACEQDPRRQKRPCWIQTLP